MIVWLIIGFLYVLFFGKNINLTSFGTWVVILFLGPVLWMFVILELLIKFVFWIFPEEKNNECKYREGNNT